MRDWAERFYQKYGLRVIDGYGIPASYLDCAWPRHAYMILDKDERLGSFYVVFASAAWMWMNRGRRYRAEFMYAV